jgi:hypothetical protein
MKREAKSGDSDVLKWWNLMAYDIITTIAFGEGPRLVEPGKVSNGRGYVGQIFEC